MHRFKLFIRHHSIGLAIIIALLAIGGAGLVYMREYDKTKGDETFDVESVLPPSIPQPASPGKAISVDELKRQNGKDGNRCYIALDGTVYEVTQGRLWNDGEHDPSGGDAYCSADLSDVIDQSPHGRSKIQELQAIGKLEP